MEETHSCALKGCGPIFHAVSLALWLSAYFVKVFHVRFGDNTQP